MPTLAARIIHAETLARDGKSVEEIKEATGLSQITAYCTHARVTGQSDGSRLKINRLEE